MLISTILVLAAEQTITNSAWYVVGQILAPFFVGLLAGVTPKIVSWFKNRRDKKKYSSALNIEDTAQDDLRIQDLITELRMRGEADRAVVYLFHNGGCFFDGSPIKKISMVYETVRLGVSYVSGESKDILVSHVPDLISSLMVNGNPCLFKTKDLNDGYWKHVLQSKNVSYAMYKKITNGPKIIGFLGFNFCGEKDAKVMDSAEIGDELGKLLEEYSSQLEVVLTRRLTEKHYDKKD